MNVPADFTATPDFAQSLLNLAEWLDSQDLCAPSDARKLNVNLCNVVVNDYRWENTMNYMEDGQQFYYSKSITNKERVLAVLMLREMVLSGDI